MLTRRRRRFGPLESRGDILREARKLEADYARGRIGRKAYGSRLYLLNLMLDSGTRSWLSKYRASVRLSRC